MRLGSNTRRSGRDYSRRQFGQAAAGIVLFFSMRPGAILGQPAPARLPADLEANSRLDSWLRINPEGNIEVSTGKVELGQGNLTASTPRIRLTRATRRAALRSRRLALRSAPRPPMPAQSCCRWRPRN